MTKMELIQIARDKALALNLDPAIVCALCEQESAWDTYAIRSESESGFMTRYGPAFVEIVKKSASTNDDKWIRFEDIFYCSYGLMQTMYPVLIETFPAAAAELRYPTYLCNPATGIDYGCRLFAHKLKQAGGNTEKALGYWNGGGRPAYAGEVMGKRAQYL